MKQNLLVLLLMGLFASPLVAQGNKSPEKRSLNVLFIGNSMTWFCNMPRTVAELAETMDPPVRINYVLSCQALQNVAGHAKDGSVTRARIAHSVVTGNPPKIGPGGIVGLIEEQNRSELRWLEAMAAGKPDDPAIKADLLRLRQIEADVKAQVDPKWDVIVIQPYGGDIPKGELSKNLKILQDDIAKAAPNARVLMYMDATGQMHQADNNSLKRIQDTLAVYRQLAIDNKVEVAPAALTCQLICREKPAAWLKIEKLPKDSHPGLRGSYAIACSIFTAIFDRSPEGLPAPRMEAHYQINRPKTGSPIRFEDKVHMQYFDDGPIKTLPNDDKRFIQAKAWQAWREWKTFREVPAK